MEGLTRMGLAGGDQKVLRYGLAGYGTIGRNRIAREGFGLDHSRFAEPSGVRLLGACDLNNAFKSEALSLGLRWFDSYEQMLDDPEIDAVFIATNNKMHYPMLKQAVDRGKHCLVEKPIAVNLSEGEEILRLAKTSCCKLAVDHMMVHNVYNVAAHRTLRTGAIGDVNDIHLHIAFLLGHDRETAASWRCADPEELGGPIGDVGSHCFYIAEFLLDTQIESIACVYAPRTMGIPVEEGAFIEFHTKRGVSGTVYVAFNRRLGCPSGTFQSMGFEVYGTQGIIRAYGTLCQFSGHEWEPHRLRVEIDDFRTVKPIEVESVHNIYQEVIKQHATSIRADLPNRIEDAVHNLSLILACHESAHQGGRFVQPKY